jgi:hypothetical protein
MTGGVEMAVGSQSDYAKHANISRQMVSKLVKQGKIPKRPDGKIDFAVADHARKQNSDPGRVSVKDEPAVTAPAGTSGGGVSFNDAKTASAAYDAKLKQLAYEEKMGALVPIRDVENAMVASGRQIRRALDTVLTWADEIDAAARNGGVDAVRAKLKERVRGLEESISESLNLMANDDQA